MPTNQELSDYLAGKLPLKQAGEIDQQVRDSATVQARVASLPVDPIVERLRKVWNRQNLSEDGQPIESTLDGSVLIDRYCLLERIGMGGMGQVWKAKVAHGVSPIVALKLVKPGLDSKEIIERFELERKALAMMDHPCIAKVLDGGSTDQGQSYFVMEFVDGLSITGFCDQHQLGIEQRLRLFVQVCRAVQHAHQKGIIHRDLKPSNILVTQYDDQPLPKVIDFGLAKALGSVSVTSDDSQLTEYGALIGTVRYMSPEQVDSKSWDIDTRSDIYSLGVVLYELLTGTTPIHWTDDSKRSLLNILQSIREIEPPRPSERLSASSQLSSAERSMSNRAIRHILRRDLDWIVMKAIEKNRDRRYQTAEAFSQDIDRFLTGQPVAARPPAIVYRIGKFVKKNRGQVTIAVALLMMALAGVANFVWSSQAYRQKQSVFAAASYSSVINELNLMSVSRRSGWTHRGLNLIQDASAIRTPLREARQLRDWTATLLTTPDFDMRVQKRFTATESPTDMAFSPSGRRLAVGLAPSERVRQLTILLIDLDSGVQQWLTPDTSGMDVESEHDPSVTSVRFGKDDNTLFVGTRHGLLLRLALDQSPPTVACALASRGGVLVRLSADGRYCVTATSRLQKQPGETDERMRCFDPETLELLGVSDANQRVETLSIAPDSSRVSVSLDIIDADPPQSIEYSLPDFKQLQTFPGQNAEYHPLGHAVFTGGKGTYKRLNLEKKYDASIYLPSTSLAWTPHRVPTFQHFQVSENGAVLAESAQADKCIFFWREAEPIPMMSFRLSGNRNITGYALAPTLDSIAVMTEDALELYSYTNRQEYRRVISLPSRVAHFAVAHDQGEFAVLADQVLYRYRMPELQQLASGASGFSTITRNAIAYSPNNQQFASTRTLEDRVFEIVIADRTNANSQKVIRVPSEPEERFDAPKLVGLGWIDDDHLVAAVDFRLLVVNTKSGQLESATPQHNPNRQLPSYRAIALRGDRCVTITENGTLQAWNWTGSELTRDQSAIELQTSEAERLAWHPSRDYVVVGTQSGSIQSIDLRLRKSVFADQTVHSGEICGAAWCNSERLVTASRDGKLALWQNTSGVLKPYVAWDSRSGISAIDVSADGRQCYVASASESISIFDFASMDEAFAQLGIADK